MKKDYYLQAILSGLGQQDGYELSETDFEENRLLTFIRCMFFILENDRKDSESDEVVDTCTVLVNFHVLKQTSKKI